MWGLRLSNQGLSLHWAHPKHHLHSKCSGHATSMHDVPAFSETVELLHWATERVASIFQHNPFMLGCSRLNESVLSSAAHGCCGCCRLIKDSQAFLPVPNGEVYPTKCTKFSSSGPHHHCPFQVIWSTWSVQQYFGKCCGTLSLYLL